MVVLTAESATKFSIGHGSTSYNLLKILPSTFQTHQRTVSCCFFYYIWPNSNAMYNALGGLHVKEINKNNPITE